MRPGYIDNSHRVYFRCNHCGDSNNPLHAHGFVDSKGNTYCWRCGEFNSLSMTQYLYVALNVCDLEEVIDESWVPFDLEPMFPQGRRNTLLARYHHPSNQSAECFSMRDARGKLIGWHSRFPQKRMLNEGNRGICWPGADDTDPVSLTSSIDQPLYLVEGPYDTIRPRYVSCYGSISPSSFRHTKAQYVWAWPDPDVLSTIEKRKRFVDMLNVANDNHCWVKGLIVSDDDPDVCKVKRKISLSDANNYIRSERA